MVSYLGPAGVADQFHIPGRSLDLSRSEYFAVHTRKQFGLIFPSFKPQAMSCHGAKLELLEGYLMSYYFLLKYMTTLFFSFV